MSSHEVGSSVVVEGRADPAAAGAAVTTDDGDMYYIAGLQRWDPDVELKRVTVSGLLRMRKGSVPELPPEEPQRHGLVDDTFVIENASWSLVQSP
jgi:hypothetical protein